MLLGSARQGSPLAPREVILLQVREVEALGSRLVEEPAEPTGNDQLFKSFGYSTKPPLSALQQVPALARVMPAAKRQKKIIAVVFILFHHRGAVSAGAASHRKSKFARGMRGRYLISL